MQDHNGGAASAIVKADSVLAATAREMLAAHGGPAPPGGALPLCARCGAVLPCPPVRAATQVLAAAGLPLSGPDTPAADAKRPWTGTGRAAVGTPGRPDGPASAGASATAVLPTVSVLPVARYLPGPPADDTLAGSIRRLPAPAGYTR